MLHYVKGLHIIKDNLFPLPPVFKLIQQESKAEWKEMYQVFNMGHRLELYCDTSVANQLILIAGEFGIEARVIGRCELSEQKQVTIRSVYGEFNYH